MTLPLMNYINLHNVLVCLCYYNKSLETWHYINNRTLFLNNLDEVGKFVTTPRFAVWSYPFSAFKVLSFF